MRFILRSLQNGQTQQVEYKIKQLADAIQQSKHPTLEIQMINIISKEIKRIDKHAQRYLDPIINLLTTSFAQSAVLAQLNYEQIGILNWSLGNIDIPNVHKNIKLFEAIENHLLYDIDSDQLAPIGICSIVYTFSKLNIGSELFWQAYGDLVLKKKNDFDNAGISIILNAFGRSEKGSLQKFIKPFEPLILRIDKEFRMKEYLMMMSGIATEMTQKFNTSFKFEEAKNIFDMMANNILDDNMIKTIELQPLTTIIWAYSLIPDSEAQYREFWRKSTQDQMPNLKWHQLTNIMFSLSQLNTTTRQNLDWEPYLNAFKKKISFMFDQEKVIKCLTSFSLANVGDKQYFWQPVMKLMNEKINFQKLDSYLLMNLLWSLARNLHKIDEVDAQMISQKAVERLKLNVREFVESYNQRQILQFIPNLVWSSYELRIEDQEYWNVILEALSGLSNQFNIKQLYSIVPVLEKLSNIQTKKTMHNLEQSMKTLSMSTLDKDETEKYQILSQIFERYNAKFSTLIAEQEQQQ
ncbi:UNKNOWN [Stylonychia lemnae]|uniref:Uncharacterized protein n=1 Tax=Stylonychia lemnae TaxID=5949 RepID=A0A078A722_STYLE|nr:UNKNOWN [Stylonychia lemnae]|eukprot:CDW78039.1 UNKNOWN [Stylonychia lemnae]